MRKEHNFSEAKPDPPSGRLRWARKNRYILLLSIICATSLYGAVVNVTTITRTLVLLAVSYVTACVALLMLGSKVRAKGWKSLKEPPLIASMGFLVPLALVVVGALVIGTFLLYALWQFRDWD